MKILLGIRGCLGFSEPMTTHNIAINDETETYEAMEDRLALEAEFFEDELAEDVRKGRASYDC